MNELHPRPLEDMDAQEYSKAYTKLVSLGKQTSEDINKLTTYVGLATEWEVFSRSLYIITVNSGKLTRWAHGLVHEFSYMTEKSLDQETKNYFRLNVSNTDKKISIAVHSTDFVMGRITLPNQEMIFYHPVNIVNTSTNNGNFEDLIITHELKSDLFVYNLKNKISDFEKIHAQSQWIPVIARSVLPVISSPQDVELFSTK